MCFVRSLASVQEQRLPCTNNTNDGRLSPSISETPPITPPSASQHSKVAFHLLDVFLCHVSVCCKACTCTSLKPMAFFAICYKWISSSFKFYIIGTIIYYDTKLYSEYLSPFVLLVILLMLITKQNIVCVILMKESCLPVCRRISNVTLAMPPTLSFANHPPWITLSLLHHISTHIWNWTQNLRCTLSDSL